MITFLRLLVSLTIVTAGSGSLWGAWGQGEAWHRDVLATVGDRPVTSAQLVQELDRRASQPGTRLDTGDPEERRKALDALTRRQLLKLAAMEVIPRAQAIWDSVATYEALRLVWSDISRSLYPPPEALTDSAIAEFRERRTARWFGRHLVVPTEMEVALAMRRLDDGEPFDTVARDMSTDIGSRAAGGRLRPARYGDWYPQLIDFFFDLDPGTYGGPVETRFGLHLAYCDSITYDPEIEFIATDDYLRVLRQKLEYMSRIDDWAADAIRAHGIEVVESGVDTVFAHLLSMTRVDGPPAATPRWVAPGAPMATWNDGGKMTVHDFIGYFGALGFAEWPRPQNRPSIYTAAQRLAIATIELDAYREGRKSWEPEVEAAIVGAANRHLGDLFIRAEIDPGEQDSLSAEAVFEAYPERFMLQETVSIASLTVPTHDLAQTACDWVHSGMPFEEAAEKIRERDNRSVFVPYTAFFPRGAFPDTDHLIFALEEGEITDPVYLSGSYHVYQVVRKRPPRQPRRVELTDEEIRKVARRALGELALEERMTELEERWPIRYDDDAMARWIDGDGS